MANQIHIHNERVKLLSAFFNNLGVAGFVAAALAPLMQV
jgi:hypothetical protein